MSLPARKQTFAMENCQDVLNKLEWEIDALKACPVDQGPEPIIYHGFNCAVTAWALTDWVWLDMTPTQQARWGINLKEKVVLPAFQESCRAQCRALHLCQHIAVASKHGEGTRHPDLTVGASVSVDERSVRAGDRAGTPLRIWKWKLAVYDGPQARDAVQVFEEALHFWDHFIIGQGIPADPQS